MACNVNCRIEIEGLVKKARNHVLDGLLIPLKVTGSHVHCKSGNISETVQHRDVVIAGR